jgi:hypothetical protein
MNKVTQRFSVALVTGALLVVAGNVRAQQFFSLDDVRGDDDGGGTLLYPNRPDLQKGDLDLVRLSAEQRADGIWFIAEMGQPIRSPEGRVTEIGQVPVDRLARNGFYTFNLDIYVDKDRVAGLGQTDALPGRGVTVDRQFAWEKCIVLTPRPETARTMLQVYFDRVFEADLRAKQGKISKQEFEALQSNSEAHVNELYFFPNKVRVSGRKIEFQVPTEFLGGAPSPSWGYTAVVTAADLEQAAQPGQLNPDKATMMAMGVGPGLRSDLWGIRSDTDSGTPPVIDLLATDPNTQPGVLADYDTVAGRLAAVPGIAPDGKAAVAPTGVTLTMEQAARLETATPAGKAPAVGAAATPSSTERRAVPARLRTLNQLLEEGLITQAEYDELRRKILAEL